MGCRYVFLLSLFAGKGEQEHALWQRPFQFVSSWAREVYQQVPCVRLFSSSGIGCRSPDKNGQTGLLVDVAKHGYVIRPI